VGGGKVSIDVHDGKLVTVAEAQEEPLPVV